LVLWEPHTKGEGHAPSDFVQIQNGIGGLGYSGRLLAWKLYIFFLLLAKKIPKRIIIRFFCFRLRLRSHCTIRRAFWNPSLARSTELITLTLLNRHPMRETPRSGVRWWGQRNRSSIVCRSSPEPQAKISNSFGVFVCRKFSKLRQSSDAEISGTERFWRLE